MKTRIPIGLDLETDLITAARAFPRIVCGSLALRTQDTWVVEDLLAPEDYQEGRVVRRVTGKLTTYLFDEESIRAVWQTLAQDPGIEFYIHNAAFDVPCLMEQTGNARESLQAVHDGRVRCTVVREKLAALAFGELSMRIDKHTGKLAPSRYNLAELVYRYTGRDISVDKTSEDAWRKRYGELRGIPLNEWPERAKHYAMDDAAWHFRMAFAQERAHPPTAEGKATRETYGPGTPLPWFRGEAREVRASIAVALSAAWGLRTDPEQVTTCLSGWRETSRAGKALGIKHKFVRDARHKRGKKKGQPTKQWGTVDKKALGALVQAAYEARGLEVPRTETGKISTKESVLRESGSDVLRRYADTLKASSWLSKYEHVLLRGTVVPITHRPNSLVASGRTSARSPNTQQFPKNEPFRRCIVARPGYLFAQADYDQVELRTHAQVNVWKGFGDTMARAFRAGKDPHVIMAVAIMEAEGLAPPVGTDWTYDLAVACTSRRHGDEWFRKVKKKYRQMAKAANFGLPGGLGAETFTTFALDSYDVDLTGKADDPDGPFGPAVRLKRLWLTQWPEMAPYLSWITTQLGWASSFTVEQPVSGRIRGKVGYCNGANTYFQGLAADIFKAALWRITRECYADPSSPLYGCRVSAYIHDEFLLECPEDRAAAAGDRLAEIMIEEAERHCPDVPFQTSPVLMDRWELDAETIRDEHGNLQVYKAAA